MQRIYLLFIFCFSFGYYFSQGDCNNSAPFCTGTTYNFPASTNTTSELGPDYDCLFSQPNPAWYYLQVSQSGQIVIDMYSSNSVDIDFICWGPFTSPTGACTAGLNAGAVIDCSYSTAAAETCTIPNAQVGEYYMLLITNFSGVTTNIIFSQSNTGGSGAGATNCNILCNITAMTATPGACNPATNTFNVTGTISTYAPPNSGTLTITSSCGGTTTLNAPFNPTANYTVTGIPANGAPCTITAQYSADPFCTYSVTINAPAPCTVNPCAISSVTSTPGACNTTTNTFDVSGAVTFTNPPSSGSLTVSSSCGGTQTFNTPFTSPLSYTLTSLPSNGASCTVTASFSANAGCTNTSTFTAPPSCTVSCSISSVTSTPGACNTTTNTFDVTGSVTFTNPPSSGSLTVSSSCGGSQTFNAPFTSPQTYTLSSLPSNGLSCTVTAVFSANSACTNTSTFNAPPSCLTVTCTTTASNNGPLCEGQALNFSCGTSGATSYAWSGPNSFTAAVQNPGISNPTVAASGIYTVTVTNPNGSVCVATTTVQINPSPNADAGQTMTICSGGSVQLNATGGTSYNWTPATGLSSNSISNPTASPANTTLYTVVVGNNGCFSTDTVTVFVVSQLTAGASADVSICQGQSTQLNATGGTTYLWTPSSGLSATNISNPVAAPSVTTTYSVIVSAGSSCPSDTADVTVTVFPAFNVGISANDSICAGESGTVFASGAITYQWLPGGSNNDSITDSPINTTTYTVTGTNGLCTDSAMVSIIVLPGSTASFTALTPLELGNYEVCFENNSGIAPGVTSYWEFGDLDTSYAVSPCHVYQEAGTYNICLTISSSFGCTDTFCSPITLKPDWTLYVPNSFTPNGDMVNDMFYAAGTNLDAFELLIFDRWGNKIYNSKDITEGWNGTVNNKGSSVVQIDTYVWKIKFKDTEGKPHTRIGHVNVVR